MTGCFRQVITTGGKLGCLSSGESQAARKLKVEYSEKILSVTEAVEGIGVSHSHFRRLSKNGAIKGKKLGHDWVVLSLDRKRKRRPKERKK